MAIIDIAGIASIMPFFIVLSDSSLVQENKFLMGLYNFFNFIIKHWTSRNKPILK